MFNMKLFVILLVLGTSSCYGQEICSNRDISNERKFSAELLAGEWHQHFNEDNTPFGNIIPVDSKFFFLPFGNNLIQYYYGRSQTGTGCSALVFLNRQRTPDSPCISLRQISPELGDNAEFIYSLLPGNDQLLLSFCVNPPTCTTRAACALTRRKVLCRGERNMFLRKFRVLKIPSSFNFQQRPASNNCTVAGLDRGKANRRVRSCREVTDDIKHHRYLGY